MADDRRARVFPDTTILSLKPGWAEPRLRDLRARISAALGTTDAARILEAILAYVGTYESAEEYVARRIAALLPPGFGWVVHCCDARELRRQYEAEVTELWTIEAPDGAVMVFESALPGSSC